MKCTDKEWDTCQVEKMGCYGCYYDEHKIQVGYFVRTNQGIIGKIKRIELDKIDKALKWYVFDKKRPNMNIIDEIYINKPYITKYSKNILDLIEVGDILKLKEDNDICYIGLEKDTTTINYTELKESIKNGECELLEILT